MSQQNSELFPPGEMVSMSEYARRRGIHRSTVTRAVQDGTIKTHGSKRLINIAEADAGRRENLDPGQIEGGRAKPPPADAPRPAARAAPPGGNETAPAPGFMTYSDARAKRETLKYHKEALELAKAKEQLIERAKAKRAMQEMGAASSRVWVQWPSRVYAQIAAELGVESARVHAVLDRHVRTQLETVAAAPIEFKL